MQPVCREQDVELSSIVALNLQVMTFGICVPKRHLKTVFLNLLDHCCFGPKFRCENHAFWRPVHQKTFLSCPCQVRFHPCGRRSLKWPLNEGYPLPSKPSNFWATNIFFPPKSHGNHGTGGRYAAGPAKDVRKRAHQGRQEDPGRYRRVRDPEMG